CAFRRTAENLARGIADAGAMEKSWLSSPEHRDNLLNPNYRLTGVAVAQNPLTAVVLFADTCGGNGGRDRCQKCKRFPTRTNVTSCGTSSQRWPIARKRLYEA